MVMEIEISNPDDQIRISLWGRMDTEGAEQFGAETAPLDITQGQVIDIDMAQLTFIGSAGIGKLVSFFKKTQTAGGSLHISNLTGDLQTLFSVMKLDRIFNL
jgi:anti-anti-sigma factor